MEYKKIILKKVKKKNQKQNVEKTIYNDDCTIESKTISKTPIYKLYIYVDWKEWENETWDAIKKVHERDLK